MYEANAQNALRKGVRKQKNTQVRWTAMAVCLGPWAGLGAQAGHALVASGAEVVGVVISLARDGGQAVV